MASQSVSYPIIDSHIHLYPEGELSSCNWATSTHPLQGRRSIAEYREASGFPANLRGLILIEADRKNDDAKDWTHPLEEIAWLRRIVTGQPRDGEGHTAEDAKLCVAIVPWAPVVLGEEPLAKFLEAAEKEAGPAWSKVKGFRYLLQDKPNGTAVRDDFVAGLRLLGRKGYVFDLGIDQHKRGRIQLEEAVQMIDRAHEGVQEDDKVVIILNHLCKPDLGIVNPTDPAFIAWRTAMFTFGKCSKTYIKLSGCLAELPVSLQTQSAEAIFEAIFPWLAVVLAAFKPSRIMFGSNWPVCAAGVGDDAWRKWHKIVERTCYMTSLNVEDQMMIWGGTAKKAYRIEE